MLELTGDGYDKPEVKNKDIEDDSDMYDDEDL